MAKKVRLKSRKQQGEPQQSKRQSSIVIRSMASKRVFFNKFSNSIRKLKLVYESNYRRESRCSDNLLSSGKDSRAVISRCHPSMVISYPEPSKLFPWANNY